jgi:hypothetical protein
MKKQLAILNKLKIDFDLFYVVSVKDNEIRLQGRATQETIDACKFMVDFEFNQEWGFLTGERNGISITLTF